MKNEQMMMSASSKMQWQGRGFSAQLLRMPVQVGRDERLDRITGLILARNHAIQAVSRDARLTPTPVGHEAEVDAELDPTTP